MMIAGIGAPYLWAGFIVFVLLMLALDMGLFHKKAHVVQFREALMWSTCWISLALLFGLGVFHWMGSERGLEFLTAYFVEEALSVDNLFVFLVIFSYFQVPRELEHRVLFWGIIGALVMRAIFILIGGALLKHFHWTIYLFGGLLLCTGIKLLLERGAAPHPENNPLVRFIARRLPVTTSYHGNKFVITSNGRRMFTPLFMALVTIEISDVIFAVDSIPAVLAVSREPFIVFTSNIFAILGLRSLYFVLAGIMHRFQYLKLGLSAVLIFIGGKMLLSNIIIVPVGISLCVVASLIGLSIAASILVGKPSTATVPADSKAVSKGNRSGRNL